MEIEAVIRMIRSAEGEKLEFKKEISREIGKDVCALANTRGGYILLGVDDDGNIIGVDAEKTIQRMSDIVQGIYPAPKVSFEKSSIGAKEIVIIQVETTDKLFSLGNVVYIRIGRNNRPLSTQEVIEKAAESAIVFFDELPANAPPIEIQDNHVERYLKEREKVRGVRFRGTIRENALKMKIIIEKNGKIVPSNGGLLFFSSNPQKYIPNSRVRLIWFEDEEMSRYRDDKEFSGPLWKITDDIEHYFSKNLRIIGGDMAGWRRREILEYPMEALREATINALIHRNYFDAAETIIFITPSRMLIRNPGSFPPGVSIENPVHKPRNPLLSQYMYDMGYIEKYGSGINKIKRACEEHALVEVKFDLLPYRTEVVFEKTKLFELTESDKTIISAIQKGKTTSTEIAEYIKLSKVSTVSKLNNLINLGIIAKEGKGRSTRYRVVRAMEE